MSAVGFEIALTRFFAVAQWSEYGYWIISIAMVGFALSGATMAIFRDGFVRRGEAMRAWLPPLLLVAAAAGFHFTVANPFNPLRLQNATTWSTEIWNIAGYYAALFPFFFLTGLYISLCFVLNSRDVGRVYGYDLLGAGAGAVTGLALMLVLDPFHLPPALMVPLTLAAFFTMPSWPRAWRIGVPVAAVAALLGGGALLLSHPGGFNEFKAIYAPLQTPDARVLAERRLPRGHYMLLDDFLERVDTDLSNNAGMMGLPGPPSSFGLYRDGNRIAALPKPHPERQGALDVGYAPSTLDSAPYALRPGAAVLMLGASGGFRPTAALSLGASRVTVLEPEPVLRGARSERSRPVPGPAARPAPDNLGRLAPGGAARRRGLQYRGPLRRLPRGRRSQRHRLHGRGDRRRAPRPRARRHPVAAGLHSRLPGLCPAPPRDRARGRGLLRPR
ncbi:hypothetical protein ACE7GA_11350 [Roseomonas sp. CCTCC AB2023176]|uniref:hypothetical protein n=1 Tax=Roseomonas sp. CCTCC AB2023176 TaxID=3342640 RepID=UPI0035E2B642